MFENRIDAAHQLVSKLETYKDGKNAIIFAIPRGGLELGAVLRDELKLPLDIVVTKKIGAPGNEEYAIGVVDLDGMAELNEKAIADYGISRNYIEQKIDELSQFVKTRYAEYKMEQPQASTVKDKTVILVDDGVATGFTTLAAIHYLRRHDPKKIVLAIPVMPRSAYQRLSKAVDELVCLDIHEDFYAVAQFYRQFKQVSDEEAKKLLNISAPHQ